MQSKKDFLDEFSIEELDIDKPLLQLDQLIDEPNKLVKTLFEILRGEQDIRDITPPLLQKWQKSVLIARCEKEIRSVSRNKLLGLIHMNLSGVHEDCEEKSEDESSELQINVDKQEYDEFLEKEIVPSSNDEQPIKIEMEKYMKKTKEELHEILLERMKVLAKEEEEEKKRNLQSELNLENNLEKNNENYNEDNLSLISIESGEIVNDQSEEESMTSSSSSLSKIKRKSMNLSSSTSQTSSIDSFGRQRRKKRKEDYHKKSSNKSIQYKKEYTNSSSSLDAILNSPNQRNSSKYYKHLTKRCSLNNDKRSDLISSSDD